MQLSEPFPYRRLFVIILFFVAAWEAHAYEARKSPEFMGVALRSAETVLVMPNQSIPMAKQPVNFFALFSEDVEGKVELDLTGPMNFSREEINAPYSLFEAIELKPLPKGNYTLRIKVMHQGALQESHEIQFTLLPGQQNEPFAVLRR